MPATTTLHCALEYGHYVCDPGLQSSQQKQAADSDFAGSRYLENPDLIHGQQNTTYMGSMIHTGRIGRASMSTTRY